MRFLLRAARSTIERFPFVAMAYRYARDSKQLARDPKKTPMGFKLLGSPSMEDGTFEAEEKAIIKRLLERVDVVVNVGANVGYYCCLALQQGKQVVAFEPLFGNLRCLYKNLRANGWGDKIEIYPLALSNSIGIIDIFGGGTGASLIRGWAGISERYVDTVPTSTLDNVIGTRFRGKDCLFLVDIEGAERLMLEGAKTCLMNDPKPVWMVEISVTEHQPQGVLINPHLLSTFEVFWGCGYQAWTADRNVRLVNPEEVQSIMVTGRDTLQTHNFLFIKKGEESRFLDLSS